MLIVKWTIYDKCPLVRFVDNSIQQARSFGILPTPMTFRESQIVLFLCVTQKRKANVLGLRMHWSSYSWCYEITYCKQPPIHHNLDDINIHIFPGVQTKFYVRRFKWAPTSVHSKPNMAASKYILTAWPVDRLLVQDTSLVGNRLGSNSQTSGAAIFEKQNTYVTRKSVIFKICVNQHQRYVTSSTWRLFSLF